MFPTTSQNILLLCELSVLKVVIAGTYYYTWDVDTRTVYGKVM